MRRLFLILVLVCLPVFSFHQALMAAESVDKITIGTMEDFPAPSVKPFPKEQFIVFRDEGGIYAVSSRCTHMGCTVAFKNKEGIFACPCHGAKYSKEGAVLSGPAKMALAWFLIEKDSAGNLYVDKSKPVAQGTKFKF